MRSLRILSYCLGGLVVLLVLVPLAVTVIVKPNDYKGRIAQEVRASTGRNLILQGDIKVSVFPWIALEFGPASLGNPGGFGTDPFLAVQHVALRVKLLPLMRRELQVGRIEIDGLDLRLKKNAAGTGNWEDFGQKSTDPAATETSKSSTPASLQYVAGIVIKASRISDGQFTVSNFNLEVGSVSQRSAVPVRASFDLDTGPAGRRTSLDAALTITLDSAAKRYALGAVALSGELKQQANSRSLAWKFLAPAVEADLAAQTLKAPAFTAQAGSARLSGSLAGEKIISAPVFAGSVKLEPLVLREFLARLGVDLPKTRDEGALSKIAASTDFSYAVKIVRLEKLDLQLDESRLRGELAITTLAA